MSKAKKQAEKILRALEFEPAPLSTNKGRCIGNGNCPNKLNSKKKRHRGWITSRWAGSGKYKEAIENGTDATYYFDSWEDGKDGLKYDSDETHIRNEAMFGDKKLIKLRNEKLKRYTKIRKAKKMKMRLKASLKN